MDRPPRIATDRCQRRNYKDSDINSRARQDDHRLHDRWMQAFTPEDFISLTGRATGAVLERDDFSFASREDFDKSSRRLYHLPGDDSVL